MIEELATMLEAAAPELEALLAAEAPAVAGAIKDAYDTVRAYLSMKALPVQQAVKDIDDAAETALAAKFGESGQHE